ILVYILWKCYTKDLVIVNIVLVHYYDSMCKLVGTERKQDEVFIRTNKLELERGGDAMNLHLTAEQKMMQELVRNFARNEIAPKVDEMEKHQFPYEVIKKMGDLGLMGIPISKKYGGSGMDFTSYIIAIHEISKVSPALGVILSVHTFVGTNPFVDFCTEKQKYAYLQKLVSCYYLCELVLMVKLSF